MSFDTDSCDQRCPHLFHWGVDPDSGFYLMEIAEHQIDDYRICGVGDLACLSSNPEMYFPYFYLQFKELFLAGQDQEIPFLAPVVTELDVAPFKMYCNNGERWLHVPSNSNSRGLTMSFNIYIALLKRVYNDSVTLTKLGGVNPFDRWFLLETLDRESSEALVETINTGLELIGYPAISQDTRFYGINAIAAFDTGGSTIDFLQEGKRQKPVGFQERCSLNMIVKAPNMVPPGLVKRSWSFWQKFYGNRNINVVGPISDSMEFAIKDCKPKPKILIR